MRNTIKAKVGYVVWYRRKEPNKVFVCDGDDVLFEGVSVTETLNKIVEVHADSEQEALQKAEDSYYNGEIVLDYFEKGIRLQDTHEFYEEYKDAKLFFNKYALENKYVMLWLCEQDGSDICEIESHKLTLKIKEEILAFMKESWGEEAVTEYISNDGKQCYRVFGNIIHFQDLCERAHIECKWVDDFRQVAKGSDFELEYCEHDIILAFEK